nr:uncharacterized protein LOC101237375 [Hydra vulgaris]
MKRFRQRKIIESKPRSGRPKVTTEKAVKLLVSYCKNNPRMTAVELNSIMHQFQGTNCIVDTTKRQSRQNNLYGCRPVKKPLISIISEQKHKKWLQKRKYTFIAFSIQMVIIGMEWSLTIVTLWSYIKEMIITNNLKLIYGLVSVSYMLASTIITPFIGRYVDRRRNINTCFLICNMWMLIGNVIYSLPFSPLFLIGGRIITGFGGALKPIIYSETVRNYPTNEISSKLSILSMMVYFGFMLGPGINFSFKNIDFFIGHWHLQYANFTGLFMGIYVLLWKFLP